MSSGACPSDPGQHLPQQLSIAADDIAGLVPGLTTR